MLVVPDKSCVVSMFAQHIYDGMTGDPSTYWLTELHMSLQGLKAQLAEQAAAADARARQLEAENAALRRELAAARR